MSTTMPISIPKAAPITNMGLAFDGSKTFLAVPQLLLGQTLASFSLEFWVNLGTNAGTQAFWCNTNSSFQLLFEAVSTQPNSGARLALQLGTNLPLIFTPVLQPNTWYYVVVSLDSVGKQATLYLNAVANNPSPCPVAVPVAFGPAFLGANPAGTGQFFLGQVGPVRLWRGLLDQPNVARLQYFWIAGSATALNSSGAVIATLIANWRCNEGYGNVAYDYTGAADAALGTSSTTAPAWQVSTILKAPDFVAAAAIGDGAGRSVRIIIDSATDRTAPVDSLLTPEKPVRSRPPGVAAKPRVLSPSLRRKSR